VDRRNHRDLSLEGKEKIHLNFSLGYLKCPYCDQKAARAWELLIVFSPYMMNKVCRNCRRDIKLNLPHIIYIFMAMATGVVLIQMFAISSQLIRITLLLILIFIPRFMGKTLFVKEKDNE
jgi:prepilin signal peptidase PulO-like enzyme (type II secretory pathway)